ncbi:MAG: cupin domain-containing protein [Actinobacteria bacterium]|nr:cupin domain-containing protein [Actinomycetota bacterium]
MRYWVDSADAARDAVESDGVETHALFGAARGCDVFEQRVLRFVGSGGERRDDERDEVLYVLEGSGTATVGRELYELEPGVGIFVAARTPWRVEASEGLQLLSVLVNDPEPADRPHAVVRGAPRGKATAGRSFTLLATPDAGCASVTQFIGHIPVGRAPDHFHAYDEVIWVLRGEGELHIDGEVAPLRPGSCIHLPKTLVHCLENFGPGEMDVLGVFRPAGSPAEAYYPDGTLAQVPDY